MDGRGCALDNVFCERLWRSVKYENIYLNPYDSVRQLQTGLSDDFDLYNHQSPHQSPDYRPPAEERCVPCWRQTARCRSEPAASVWMHLIFPISWSKHWDPLQSPRHQPAQKTVSSPKSDKSKFRPPSPTPYPPSPIPYPLQSNRRPKAKDRNLCYATTYMHIQRREPTRHAPNSANSGPDIPLRKKNWRD